MSIPYSLMPVFESLTPDVQVRVGRDFERRRKSKAFAYLAWFFFGWHYLYLRRVGLQFAFWLSCLALIGFVWWFVDLFRVSGLVDQMNEDLARQLMVEYKALGS